MEELLAKLQSDSPAIAMIILILGLGLMDWAFGVIDAIRNSLFDLKYLDVWVRKQLLGRILPVVLVLAFSQVFGTIDILGFQLNLLWIGGQTAAIAYALTTINSIIGSLNPSVSDTLPKE